MPVPIWVAPQSTSVSSGSNFQLLVKLDSVPTSTHVQLTCSPSGVLVGFPITYTQTLQSQLTTLTASSVTNDTAVTITATADGGSITNLTSTDGVHLLTVTASP